MIARSQFRTASRTQRLAHAGAGRLLYISRQAPRSCTCRCPRPCPAAISCMPLPPSGSDGRITSSMGDSRPPVTMMFSTKRTRVSRSAQASGDITDSPGAQQDRSPADRGWSLLSCCWLDDHDSSLGADRSRRCKKRIRQTRPKQVPAPPARWEAPGL